MKRFFERTISSLINVIPFINFCESTSCCDVNVASSSAICTLYLTHNCRLECADLGTAIGQLKVSVQSIPSSY